MKHLLTEEVTIQGVQLQAKSPQTGGPLLATYHDKHLNKDVATTYNIDVDTFIYDGPIGIVSIRQTDSGACKIEDNTGKVFNINQKHINTIVSKIKNKAKTITLTSMEVDLTLTLTSSKKLAAGAV